MTPPKKRSNQKSRSSRSDSRTASALSIAKNQLERIGRFMDNLSENQLRHLQAEFERRVRRRNSSAHSSSRACRPRDQAECAAARTASITAYNNNSQALSEELRARSRSREGRTSDGRDILEVLRESVDLLAHRLISVILAERMYELNHFLEHGMFVCFVPTPMVAVSSSTSSRDSKDATEPGQEDDVTSPPKIPPNEQINRIIGCLRPLLIQQQLYAKHLRLWLTLSTPRIEDGNNFGVAVIEAMSGVVSVVETAATGRLDAIAEYYATRAERVQKCTEGVVLDEAAWRALVAFDENQFNFLHAITIDTKDNYATMLDQLRKNLVKLEHPRTDNSTALY